MRYIIAVLLLLGNFAFAEQATDEVQDIEIENPSYNLKPKKPALYTKEEVEEEYRSIKPQPVSSSTALATQSFFARFKIHEPWYIFPAYYSFSKPYSYKLQRIDFKAQLSFRLELLDNVMCEFCSFSFDYTQKIYLQSYNDAYSSPLRDTDLSPQLSFIYKRPFNLGGDNYINWISISYRHVSNGETEDILPEDPRGIVRSKALDRIILEMNYNKKDLNVRLRVWAILNLGIFDGNRTNPDIGKYIGYGDIKISYKYRNNLFELTLNNIINNYFTKEYWNFKGNLELGYSYGMTKNFAIFMQYIVGHGDSLYEYSLPVSRIGLGVRLRDF